MKLQYRIKDYLRDVWYFSLCKIGLDSFMPSYNDIIAGNMGFCERLVRKFDLSRLEEFNINTMRVTLAVMNASDRVLETLIEKKALVGYRDYDFERALCIALASSHIAPMRRIVEMLFREDPTGYFYRNANLFTMEMVESAAESSERWALDFIGDNSPRSIEKWKKVCSEPLLQHVREANMEMLNAMIEYGFDIHVGGDVAFAVACRRYNPEVIHELLVSGARISGDNYSGVRKAVVGAPHKVLWDIVNNCKREDYENMESSLKHRLLERLVASTVDECELDWLTKEITAIS